eukprot:GFKZ01010634.1.p1 GENE.GFKZ01010634.1~~GFKZ01010634.1.p1  ORF type:complete len:598 (+),score=53.53 GFKZ01010634.1:180-1973(+)
MANRRRTQAYNLRLAAAQHARDEGHPRHVPNGDEDRYTGSNRDSTYIASFTKGLPHNRQTGLVANPDHFKAFVRGIDSGRPNDIRRIPLGPQGGQRDRRFQSGIASANNKFDNPADVRAWESMTAGLVYDLEGPDAQAVTMPPAPKLDSDELVTEMSELYWMSLLRDVNFSDFDSNRVIGDAIESINDTPFIKLARRRNSVRGEEEEKRLRGPYTRRTIFRGNIPGDDVGPYISQFLLIGNTGIDNISRLQDGYIEYGATRIDQRVRVAEAGRDYMTTWESFLDVQNGADVRGRGSFLSGEQGYRFITTPRDLATYVHFDALYQAYLNACIIMLSLKIPFDEGLPFQDDDNEDKQQGFAHWGGPHILTLVTEVATRALKAARFQKYNTHRRLRPEAVGGLIERYHNDRDNQLFAGVRHLYNSLDNKLLNRVAQHNAQQNRMSDFGKPRSDDFSPNRSNQTRLLPMAFPEGSPMHPSYGAGHASVAGACVTVLKAFFNHEATLPFVFEANENGRRLRDVRDQYRNATLTVEGELNKLCSNISVGRDWAGVHYFTDYRESILLGEKVALQILEEQKDIYPEKYVMTVPKFDGKFTRIGN